MLEDKRTDKMDSELKTAVEKFRKIDWDAAQRKDLSEQKNFVDLKEEFLVVSNILQTLIDTYDPSRDADEYGTVLRGCLDAVYREIKEITNLSNLGEVEKRKKAFRSLKFNIIKDLGIIFQHKTQDWDDLSSLVSEVSDTRAELKEAKDLITRSKDLSKVMEARKYGNHFGKEAKKNKEQSLYSFVGMVTSIFLLISFAFLYIDPLLPMASEEANLWTKLVYSLSQQSILISILILTALGFLVSHFSRVYSAERHLYTLNVHRQNALNSFKQFNDSVNKTESEDDLKTKNAILVQMTRAIFDNPETGYLRSSRQKFGSVNQILEVGKGLRGEE